MKADYVETCNCDFGCPCNFNGFPTYGYCRALVLTISSLEVLEMSNQMDLMLLLQYLGQKLFMREMEHFNYLLQILLTKIKGKLQSTFSPVKLKVMVHLPHSLLHTNMYLILNLWTLTPKLMEEKLVSQSQAYLTYKQKTL